MLDLRSWTLLALTLAATACGGGSGSGTTGTPITCAWLAGSNCWKDSVTAATACTDAAATGTFNAATTLCTYVDGATVRFDPSWPATVSYAAFHAPEYDTTWDFTVLTSTAAPCADLRSDGSLSLTTRLGTFTMASTASTVEFTCPDGSRYSLPGLEVLNCLAGLPGSAWSRGGAMSFSLVNGPPATSRLWSCQ
jgi:hypothetical protein